MPTVIVESVFHLANRLIIVVIDAHPHFILHFVGLSLQDIVDVNIAVDDFNGFAWFADESFDVICAGFGRAFKNDYVPSLRLDELDFGTRVLGFS